MERTRQEIYLHYSGAMKQAAELEAVAGRMKELLDGDIADTFTDAESAFKGEAGRKFQIRGRDLTDRLKSCQISLRQNAAALKNLAERVFQADMDALMIARRRDYK